MPLYQNFSDGFYLLGVLQHFDQYALDFQFSEVRKILVLFGMFDNGHHELKELELD